MKPDPEALPGKLPDGIRYIFTDVDDTLTYEGKLLPETLAAMQRLKQAGFGIVPVTGGCAGWCDMMARTWPVEAVIGENGAFYIRPDAEGSLTYRHWNPVMEQRDHQARLMDIAADALEVNPRLRLAKDQHYRLADVAIDYNQDVTGVSPPEVEAVVRLFEANGANARPSSIHVNAWIGDYDKRSMALLLLSEVFGLEGNAARNQVIFSGDAPNDEPMFAHFPLSVGVANIRPHLPVLDHQPRWITRQPGGRGFAEIADSLLGG